MAPGVVALLALSAVYVTAGDSTPVLALFAGLAPAVLAIHAQADIRVAGRALGHPALVALAVAAFLALAVFGISFPAVVAAAAAIGWALGRWAPQTMHTATGHGSQDGGPAPLIPDNALHTERPSRGHTLKMFIVAGIIGFAGNELVAIYRIRVGHEIGSAALVADGLHARTDGFTSLAVVGGALGVLSGSP